MLTMKIAIAPSVKITNGGCVSHIHPLETPSSDKMPGICFSVFTLTPQPSPHRAAVLRAIDESGIDLGISLLALRQKSSGGAGLMELEVTEVVGGGGRGMTISLQLLGMPESGLSSSLQPRGHSAVADLVLASGAASFFHITHTDCLARL